MRQVPLKNYIILSFIYLVVILLALLLRNWYIKNNNNSYINKVVSEIKKEEFESYIQENPDILIYFSNSKNVDLYLERQISNYIVKNNLSNNIVYIDTKDANEEWFKYLNANYVLDSNNIRITPNIDDIVLVKNGIIEASAVKNEALNYQKFKEFMNRYGALNND